MGARPSSFRKSGGFLNGVIGKLVSYQFTDEFNGKPFVAGRDPVTKKERFHSLYFVPQIQPDGASENDLVNTTLFVSGYDDFEVSDDGLTITPVGGGGGIGGNTPFGKLLSSICENGFDENDLPEDEINYEPLVGWRFNFVQQGLSAEELAALKAKGKATVRIDKKTKREYPLQNLVVDAAYPPEEAPAKGAAKGKPAAGKPAGKPASKAKAEVVDIDELTTAFLQGVVGELGEGETLATSKLSMKVLQGLKNDPNREDVRKRIFEDEFLKTQDGWTYNKTKRTVAAA